MTASATVTAAGKGALFVLAGLVLLALARAGFAFGQGVEIGPADEWVAAYDIDPDSTTVSGAYGGGTAYLLIDTQDNVPLQPTNYVNQSVDVSRFDPDLGILTAIIVPSDTTSIAVRIATPRCLAARAIIRRSPQRARPTRSRPD